MEIKLKEILNLINKRFSGPESCRLQDMITGKLDFDDDEITNYLTRLKDFGGTFGNHTKQNDREDAQVYLNLFSDYILKRNKNRVLQGI